MEHIEIDDMRDEKSRHHKEDVYPEISSPHESHIDMKEEHGQDSKSPKALNV